MTTKLTDKDIYEGARNLEILRGVIERHQHAKIRVAGKTCSVDAQTANALVTVHDALQLATQVKFVAMLAHSPSTLHKTVDFCWKHVS